MMKQSISILAVIWWAAGAAASQTVAELDTLPYEMFTLENGLTVLLQPDTSRREAAVEFWIKAGTAHEAPDQYGLAHFFEHVTPYGLQGKAEEWKILESNMTGSNAQTRKDFTRYYLEVRPEALEEALAYQADRLSSLPEDITAQKVEYERKRVLKEIDRQSKKALWSLNGGNALFRAAFGTGHPYGHGGYGTLANNLGFELEAFRAWHRQYLNPGRALLFVVGCIDPDSVRTLVDTYFGGIPNDGVAAVEPDFSHRAFVKPGRQTATTNADGHYLAFVWETPAYGAPSSEALTLLSFLLEAKLQKEMEAGDFEAAAPAGTLSRGYQHSGQFALCAPFVNLKDTARVDGFLKAFLANVLKEGIEEEELARAKNQAATAHHKKLDQLGFQSSRIELLGEGLLFKKDPAFYFRAWSRLQALTAEEVNAAAKQWLGAPFATVLLVGAPENQP